MFRKLLKTAISFLLVGSILTCFLLVGCKSKTKTPNNNTTEQTTDNEKDKEEETIDPNQINTYTYDKSDRKWSGDYKYRAYTPFDINAAKTGAVLNNGRLRIFTRFLLTDCSELTKNDDETIYTIKTKGNVYTLCFFYFAGSKDDVDRNGVFLLNYEKNMTYGQWLKSKYNTIGLKYNKDNTSEFFSLLTYTNNEGKQEQVKETDLLTITDIFRIHRTDDALNASDFFTSPDTIFDISKMT